MAHISAVNGVVMRLCRDDDELARYGEFPNATDSMTFDEASNPDLCADINANWKGYTLSSGQLRKNGQPVAINPDSTDKSDRDQLAGMITQAITDNQTFLGLPSPTNAQTLAQVKALTRQTTGILKRIKQLKG